MKKINDYKIGTRLVMIFSAVALIMVGALVLFVGQRVSHLAEHNALDVSESVVNEYTLCTEQIMKRALPVSQALASTAEAFMHDENTSLTRVEADNILIRTQENNPELLGVYYLFEPDQFDGRNVICGPFEYNANGEQVLMIDLVVPIRNSRGDFIGIAGCDISIKTLDQAISSILPFKESGFLTVFAQDGTIMGGAGSQFTGQNILDLPGIPQITLDGIFSKEDYSFETFDDFLKEDFLIYGSHFAVQGTDYITTVQANIPTSVIYEESRSIVTVVTLLGIAALAVIILVIFFFARQLNLGVDFASEMAEGNLAARFEIDQKDEIGLLASALTSMADQLKKIVSDIRAASGNVATGSGQISSTSPELSQGASKRTGCQFRGGFGLYRTDDQQYRTELGERFQNRKNRSKSRPGRRGRQGICRGGQ